jgi:hypothetical protein
MNPDPSDPVAAKLALLPDDPLGPRAAAAVLRHARGVLIDEGRPAARLLRVWTGVLLPTVLVACALVYTWGALRALETIYVAAR